MALTVTHSTSATGGDQAGLIGQTAWNANHSLAGSVALSEITISGGSEGNGLYHGAGNIPTEGPAPGFVYLPVKGVNLNSTGDTQVTVLSPPGITTFLVNSVVILNGSIATITTAKFGLYTAASQGGTTIITQTALALTSNTPGAAGGAQSIGATNANTAFYTSSSLFLNIGTSQGAAATADFLIILRAGAS